MGSIQLEAFTGTNHTSPENLHSSKLKLIVKLVKLKFSKLTSSSNAETISEIRRRLPRSCKPFEIAPAAPIKFMPIEKQSSSCQQKINNLGDTGSTEFFKNEPTICKFCSKPFSGADFAAEHEEFCGNRNTNTADDSLGDDPEKVKYLSCLGLKSIHSTSPVSSVLIKPRRPVNLSCSQKKKLLAGLRKNPIPYATKFGKKLLSSTPNDQFENWILQYKDMFAALTRRRFRYKFSGFARIHEEDLVHRTSSISEATIRNAEQVLGLNRATWLKLAKCGQLRLVVKRLKSKKLVTSSSLPPQKKLSNQVRPKLEQKQRKGKSSVIPPNILSSSQITNRLVSVQVEDFTKTSIFKKIAALHPLNCSVI